MLSNNWIIKNNFFFGLKIHTSEIIFSCLRFILFLLFNALIICLLYYSLPFLFHKNFGIDSSGCLLLAFSVVTYQKSPITDLNSSNIIIYFNSERKKFLFEILNFKKICYCCYVLLFLMPRYIWINIVIVKLYS